MYALCLAGAADAATQAQSTARKAKVRTAATGAVSTAHSLTHAAKPLGLGTLRVPPTVARTGLGRHVACLAQPCKLNLQRIGMHHDHATAHKTAGSMQRATGSIQAAGTETATANHD